MIPPMVAGLDRMAPFLLSDVPGDVVLFVAAPVAGTLVTAIVALWRRQLALEDRLQANIERNANSAHATADAINKLSAAISGTRQRDRNP